MNKDILSSLAPEILGKRLQEARKSRGLTQEVVATTIGAARTTIVAIEKGERRLDADELIQLAALYGRNVSELVGRTQLVESFVPEFRAALHPNKAQSGDHSECVVQLQRLAEDYYDLEQRCGKPMPRNNQAVYEIKGIPVEQAAEDIAATERNRLGLGDGPISDLATLLEADRGLRIFSYTMPSQIAGIFAYTDTLGGCIGINAGHPRDRRNWSIAHEFGHYLTARFEVEMTYLHEKRAHTARERFADEFAKCFLMPAAGLTRRFADIYRANGQKISLADILHLANLYQVSVQALVLRLEDLKRLPSGTWDTKKEEGFRPRAAQKTLGLPCPAPSEDQFPARYLYLVLLAYEQSLVTEGQAANYLRTDRVSARDRLEEIKNRFNLQKETGFVSMQLDFARTLN
jgi:Zn-dependent peptidase ImmA (M78 family)/DNA-binding XRE family transcriptional regulator